VSDKYGLSIATVEKINSVFEKHPLIEKAILYGSRAKGTFKPGSDIDLVLIAPKLTLTEFLKIENDLEDLLIAQKVDLSLFHSIDNESLIDHIKRLGKDFFP
jgi:predicted nucleotidyltransferase